MIMNLIPGSQRADTLRAIVASPNSTINETQIAVQKIGHQTCSTQHIKNTMQKYGIKRVRVRGAGHKYAIPQAVINAVHALENNIPVVNKSKIDRVWTPEMRVYPKNHHVVSL